MFFILFSLVIGTASVLFSSYLLINRYAYKTIVYKKKLSEVSYTKMSFSDFRKLYILNPERFSFNKRIGLYYNTGNYKDGDIYIYSSFIGRIFIVRYYRHKVYEKRRNTTNQNECKNMETILKYAQTDIDDLKSKLVEAVEVATETQEKAIEILSADISKKGIDKERMVWYNNNGAENCDWMN